MGRAQEAGALELHIHNLRDWTTDRHHVVDDAPFGGGQGMVMKAEPIFAAVESLRSEASTVVLMTPQGRRFDQPTAHEFSARKHLIILCGHYEGVDHRVIDRLVDVEISIGDYAAFSPTTKILSFFAEVGRDNPTRIRMVVVLPAPLGPINPRMLPRFSVSDRLSSATNSPKCFESSRISTTGV